MTDLTDENSPTELLRFSTCGSVDDGKSTLIGRLLYDSKSLFEDQLAALESAKQLSGNTEINLANLTDGLRAEREQGITIDVAYRYFATPNRKFIVADTPGHVQYTRNMVTGASTANLAVVLVDARKGVIEQTRRHSYIASLLGIPHLVLCVNKMDLVDYDQDVFTRIRNDFEEFSTRLGIQDITYIPVSALGGDNVVDLSENMPWYNGPPLLSYLENVHIANDRNLTHGRLPVQWVIRPRSDEYHDFRAYSGQIASGVFKVGEEVVILPSGKSSRIKDILNFEDKLPVAYAPMSIAVRLEDEVDVSRGDMIVAKDNVPHVSRDIDAMVCWMHDRPMLTGKHYAIKHTVSNDKTVVKELLYRVDINTLESDLSATSLGLNEVGRVKLKTQNPLIFDAYTINRSTGSFILIDGATHATVGAGMICEPALEPPMPKYEGYVI